jgi:hypothetical protein
MTSFCFSMIPSTLEAHIFLMGKLGFGLRRGGHCNTLSAVMWRFWAEDDDDGVAV